MKRAFVVWMLAGGLPGCAFGNGIGTGVVRSTEPVDGQDVSASITSYHLDGYIDVASVEAIAGMSIGSVRARSRSADLSGAGANNHSGGHSMVYVGAGFPVTSSRGVSFTPYFLFGKSLYGSDILPADVAGEIEVGAEIGIYRLWGIKGLARHGFALRVAFLQVDGNLVDPDMLEEIGGYTGRGMIFVLSWRTSRWRFSL